MTKCHFPVKCKTARINLWTCVFCLVFAGFCKCGLFKSYRILFILHRPHSHYIHTLQLCNYAHGVPSLTPPSFSLSGTIKFNFSKLLNEFETCSLHWVCSAGAGVTMRPFAAPPAPCSRPAGSLVLATGGKWNHSISSAAASGLGSLQHSLFAPRSDCQGVNGTSRRRKL